LIKARLYDTGLTAKPRQVRGKNPLDLQAGPNALFLREKALALSPQDRHDILLQLTL
jgi:hypothetical protein